MRQGGVTIDVALARLKKKLEVDEATEEHKEGLNKDWAAQEARSAEYFGLLETQIASGRVKVVNTLRTDASSEES